MYINIRHYISFFSYFLLLEFDFRYGSILLQLLVICSFFNLILFKHICMQCCFYLEKKNYMKTYNTAYKHLIKVFSFLYFIFFVFFFYFNCIQMELVFIKFILTFISTPPPPNIFFLLSKLDDENKCECSYLIQMCLQLLIFFFHIFF